MNLYSTLPLFSLQPETKEIPLTRGFVAIVDANDYEWLAQWKWHANKGGTTWYAMRDLPRQKRKMGSVSMHRLILGITDSKVFVDHIDMNGLNNTRANLRIASRQQNGQNQVASARNTSGYKGVSWHKDTGKWQAYICIDQKFNYLGLFTTPEEAAKAYDKAAKKYFGEFAKLNLEPTV